MVRGAIGTLNIILIFLCFYFVMTCVGIKGDDELSDFILDFQAKIQNSAWYGGEQFDLLIFFTAD